MRAKCCFNYANGIIKNCIGIQVVKMLVAVVVLFVICWGPILVDNMLTAYGYLPRVKVGTYKHLNTAFQLMAYFNRQIDVLFIKLPPFAFVRFNFSETRRFTRTLLRSNSFPQCFVSFLHRVNADRWKLFVNVPSVFLRISFEMSKNISPSYLFDLHFVKQNRV